MKLKLTKGQLSLIVIFLVLVIDQVSKIWVKTNMSLHQYFEITSWFKIYFIENPGMAFGTELFNKLFLTIFRIIFVGFFGYLLVKCIRRNYPAGFIVCFSLIIAGAAGNIIDSLFYGQIFTDSYGRVAELLPENGGYAPVFYGKVVDMLYFPLFRFSWPEWMPFVGGDDFEFFRPVFNVADSAITVGVALMLLFYHKYLDSAAGKSKKSDSETK